MVLPLVAMDTPWIFTAASVAAWVWVKALEAAMGLPGASGSMKVAVPDRLTAAAVPPVVAVSRRFCFPLVSVTMVALTPASALLMASRTPARVF